MKITLAQALKSLSSDALAFMASSDANQTIVGDQIPKVVNRLNSVLRRLAVKFTLSEKIVRVNITADRRYYPLTEDAAWIDEDPDEPFTGDVVRILGMTMADGRSYNLNDVAKHDSILLRDNGTAFALDTYLPVGPADVIYKAATPQFLEDGSEDQSQEIDIPEALLNALYIGVAAISYEGIGGPENISMARSKWAQFEKECAEAKINSAVEVQEYEDRNLLRERGFK